MRVIEKFLKVIVFDCRERKFHDAIGTVRVVSCLQEGKPTL